MNIQQFQYVLAVAEHQHFEKAAEKCFVTQSTLSTMISRLEDELGIQIFDRKKKPVRLTSEGEILLQQMQKISLEINQLEELSRQIKGEVKGSLTIAVIPTIAPFLLPLFLQQFASKFPDLAIEVKEQTTDEIIRQLKSRDLDIGIVSTPLKEQSLVEYNLYDEPFLYFDAGSSSTSKITPAKLDMSTLCLLEEGHCMRTQVVNLCDLHKLNLKNTLNFDYKAGSIDSLLRFVKANNASTLLPYLATLDLSPQEQEKLSVFENPKPFRTVGIAVHQHFVKKKILDELIQEINSQLETILPKEELSGIELSPV